MMFNKVMNMNVSNLPLPSFPDACYLVLGIQNHAYAFWYPCHSYPDCCHSAFSCRRVEY